MKIAVIGAGGVGAYFGGRLAEAGYNVSFLVRGKHLEAIRTNGLKVDSINGNFHIKPTATDDPNSIGVVDTILVGVKAWQVPAVAQQIKPLVGEDTAILTLQNGIEAPDHLIEVFGSGAVLGGLCRLVSYLVAPGHIAHTGVNPYIMFGDIRGGPSEQGTELLAALRRAGIDAHISDNIRFALWQKFLLIAPWSGIGAVTRFTIGEICQNPETRELLAAAMREIVAVANSKDVAVTEETVAATLDFFDSIQPGGTASMQRDILEGRPSELEDQVGAVVRIGREMGIATPVHSFIYACLAPRERAIRMKPPGSH